MSSLLSSSLILVSSLDLPVVTLGLGGGGEGTHLDSSGGKGVLSDSSGDEGVFFGCSGGKGEGAHSCSMGGRGEGTHLGSVMSSSCDGASVGLKAA